MNRALWQSTAYNNHKSVIDLYPQNLPSYFCFVFQGNSTITTQFQSCILTGYTHTSTPKYCVVFWASVVLLKLAVWLDATWRIISCQERRRSPPCCCCSESLGKWRYSPRSAAARESQMRRGTAVGVIFTPGRQTSFMKHRVEWIEAFSPSARRGSVWRVLIIVVE